MADDRMAVLETVRKAIADGDVDFLREGVRVLAQAVMEAEVTELTGLPKGERDPERRLTHRNGYRDRRWDTRVGTIDLAIPRVRDGSYLPEPARPAAAGRAGPARGRPGGVRVGGQHAAGRRPRPGPGHRGHQQERGEPDLRRARRRGRARSAPGRSASSPYPYLWLDATYLKVREAGRVVSMAALVAIGVATTGERRVLGLELAAGNDEGCAWPAFIRGLVERGLHGVRLVISDDHAGLVKAVREQLLGSGWQRCRVHFTRNAQDLVPRSARSMVASAIRLGVRAARRAPRPASQLDRVIDGMARPYPRVAELLADAEPDLLAHFTFPETHRSRIRSTNPLERLNKEIKRRTGVVGIFPNRACGHPPRRHDPRRAGRRVAGRPALLPARDDGGDRRRRRSRRWASRCCSRADQIRREDDALLHHVAGT